MGQTKPSGLKSIISESNNSESDKFVELKSGIKKIQINNEIKKIIKIKRFKNLEIKIAPP
ncbi:MAG: hypothetical protein ACI4VH_06465 [Clostridia bacterium]